MAASRREFPRGVAAVLVAGLIAGPVRAGAYEDSLPATIPLFTPPDGEASEPLSDIFLPALSLGVPLGNASGIPLTLGFPGLGQALIGEYEDAGIYAGIGALGLAYGAYVAKKSRIYERIEEAEDEGKDLSDPNNPPIEAKDNDYRKTNLGFQVYQSAGGFSAYQAFRTAARSRQPHGQYEFLTKEESPGDILLAPFRFSFLGRTSTAVPIALGAFVVASAFSVTPDDYERDQFSLMDGIFSSAYSFNAGTYEEAWFRGWILPVMHDFMDNEILANGTTALIFAAAHLNTNGTPWPQFLLGFHFGYVTMRNSWTLGEAVFIHTWWDIMIFVAQYQYRRKASEEVRAKIPDPVLWLPPFELSF